MKKLIVAVLVMMIALPALAAEAPKTEEQKTVYAVGLVISRSLAILSLSPAEVEIVKQGIDDGLKGTKLEIDLATYNDKVKEFARARRKVLGEKMAGANKEFLEKAATEKGAVKTVSGMVYLAVKEGNGLTPGLTDTVKVNYRGTLPDGKEFDSSYKRGKPADFRLDGVIKCWTEGLQKMKVGGTARLVCPAAIAYGEAGAGDMILPGATLAFEIELLEVKK